VLVIDGYVRGVWQHQTKRSETTVNVQLFDPITAAQKKAVGSEAERLAAFLDTKINLICE
jgi:hypothetical protein